MTTGTESAIRVSMASFVAPLAMTLHFRPIDIGTSQRLASESPKSGDQTSWLASRLDHGVSLVGIRSDAGMWMEVSPQQSQARLPREMFHVM